MAFNLPPAQLVRSSRSSGPRDAHEQQRRVTGPVSEILDQVEEYRLSPMDVIEHHDERCLAGDVLDQLADALVGILCRDRRSPGKQTCHEPNNARNISTDVSLYV